MLRIKSDTTGYIKSISAFALPAILESVLLTAVGVVNSALVGTLGEVEVGAVAVGVTVIDIIRSALQGFSLGGTVAVSHYADDDAYCRKIASNTVAVNLCVALLFGTALFFGANGLVSLLFRKSASIIGTASDYIRIAAFSLPFLAVDLSLSSCMRGRGDARTPFIFSLCVGVFCCGLGSLLIFGFKLGVRGAAIAYLIAYGLGCLAKLGYVIFNKKSRLHMERFYRPNFKVIKLVGRIGLPSVFEQLMINTAFLGVQSVTGMLGEAALASYNSASNVIKLTYCVTSGIESTQVTLVGTSAGRGENNLARRYAYDILKIGEIITCAIGLIMFIFARQLVQFVGSGLDPSTVEQGATILRILVFSIPLTSAFQCSQGALKTCRDVRFSMLYNVLVPWCVRVPLAYVFVKFAGLGIYGMLAAVITDYAIRGTLSYLRLRQENWIIKDRAEL